MLLTKIYKSVTKCHPNFINTTIFINKNIILTNTLRNINIIKSESGSSIAKFLLFGLTGSGISFISAAIWEFELNKASMDRKMSYFKKMFIEVFRRPPKPEDVYWVIAVLNFLVFAMFRVPSNYSNYLINFPLSISSKPRALLLSMFTHLDFIHIAMNMYVLHSFSPLINYYGAPHFMAVYITGGLVSGLGSIIYKSIKNIRIPSVGASGAILSVVGLFAVMNPDLRFGIPIISDFTNFSFSAKSGVIGLIVFDICGLLLLKSSKFDHVCHLSAITFGVLYGWIGKNYTWDTRRKWMSWYYHMRS